MRMGYRLVVNGVLIDGEIPLSHLFLLEEDCELNWVTLCNRLNNIIGLTIAINSRARNKAIRKNVLV